jgi:hypothetical protein
MCSTAAAKEDTPVLNEIGVAGVNGAMAAYAGRQVYAADANFTYARTENEKPRAWVPPL